MGEEFGKILFDIILESYSDKLDTKKDLKEYLKDKAKNELLFIYILYTYAANYNEENEADIIRLKSKKKDELVGEIVSTIDETLPSALSFFSESQIKEIKMIAATDGFSIFSLHKMNDFSLDTIIKLRKLSLIFCKKEDDELLIHMPEFIKNKIKNTSLQSHNTDYDNAIFYTKALLCVYGAIDIEEAYEIIKENIKIDFEEYFSVIKFISLMELEPLGYSLDFDAIYDINIREDELEELLDNRYDIVKYNLKFYEEMISNKYLFNLKEYIEFSDYLKEYYDCDINEDNMLREEIINDYVGIVQVNEERADELLKASLEREFDVDEIEKMSIVAYIKKISRRMPQWRLGGTVDIDTTQIGRNALCWCGSGLKYKKCHGK